MTAHVSVTSVRNLHAIYRTKTTPEMGPLIEADPSLVYIGMGGNAAAAYNLHPIGFGKPWYCMRDPRGWQIAYREYLWNKLRYDGSFRERVKALHGKTLVCWCKGKNGNPDQPCHGDILARAVEYLNECAVE